MGEGFFLTRELASFGQNLVTFTNATNHQQSLQTVPLLIPVTYVLKL